MNYGIMQTGPGEINFEGVIGSGTYNAAPKSTSESATPARRVSGPAADIGVITILSAEMRAVVEMLEHGAGYDKDFGDDGRRFHTAILGAGKSAVRVVATQAVDPGQRSAMMAFEHLRAYCAPPVVVLCGIAGGIHPDLSLGDVVLAREVVYYDLRKETVGGAVQRRGLAQRVPAVIQHAINDMFTEHGEPMPIGVAGDDFRAFRAFAGPIGTGEAVVTCGKSDIREFLKRFNDKTLAVETEAGGVAQAFYEQIGGDSLVHGWLSIRGISDTADEDKGDTYHAAASRNAAAVLELLLPYLKPVQ
jgi:adenosylhomocysteine nucleosidase